MRVLGKSARVVGIDGMSPEQIRLEVQNGARFVVFQYAISIVVITFRRGLDIYFVRPGENITSKGVPYTLLSLTLGWWGIPWGPIFATGSIWNNCRGGKDVTQRMVEAMAALSMAASPVGEVPGGFIV